MARRCPLLVIGPSGRTAAGRQPRTALRQSVAAVCLLAVVSTGGCAADDTPEAGTTPTTLGAGGSAGSSASGDVCGPVSELESAVDGLADAPLETWDDRLDDVQGRLDAVVDAADPPYPSDVEAFQERLSDVAATVLTPTPDVATTLALEDTASELSVAGDLLASSLGCEF